MTLHMQRFPIHFLRPKLFMIDITLMKTATVADLRNEFRRVAAWLAHGEEVEIRRRGKPFARLSPIARAAPGRGKKIDFTAQLRATWGERVFSSREFRLMRDYERDGEDG